MFGAFIPVLELLKIKNNAPENPINIPDSFKNVIFSFKNRYDKINTMTGESVIMTPLLIGVESSSPLKKANIFTQTPKIAAKNMIIKSFLSTFSLGVKKLIIQKSAVAPNSLNIIKPNDPIYIGITSLAMV